MPNVTFWCTVEDIKPYSGPDVNQKFAGEDDLVWCERCRTHHRRGAGWEIERERLIQKSAQRIAEAIDAEALETVRRSNAT